ncbi:ABC transporter ATP-binding protein [Microvirga tunisiensis]|nr:ABC transporter ATP-binding protein [Microvirga tunisiensis]
MMAEKRAMKRRESVPIEIENVTKTYGSMTALDNVSLSIARGEFVSILGASGSGKTTLLMAIAGFTMPSSGRIRFGERDVTLTEPHKRKIGMVFQNYALFPNMTVGGNIAYPLRLRKLPAVQIAAKVKRALQTIQLDGFAERRIDQLSGGQRQRVALARAIVFEPDILLMDEPLSALDKKLREQMQIEVRHLHQDLGLTTVFVTHDQREAFTMSDRVALIDKGQFVQIGAPSELYNRPASRFVADFVGQSYFLPVAVSGDEASFAGQRLLLPGPLSSPVSRQFLVIRPEYLEISEDDPRPGENILRGIFKELIFQGESSLAFVGLPDGQDIGLRLSGRQVESIRNLAFGSSVNLALAAEQTLVLP